MAGNWWHKVWLAYRAIQFVKPGDRLGAAMYAKAPLTMLFGETRCSMRIPLSHSISPAVYLYQQCATYSEPNATHINTHDIIMASTLSWCRHWVTTTQLVSTSCGNTDPVYDDVGCVCVCVLYSSRNMTRFYWMYPHLSFAIRISIIRHRNSLHASKTGIEIDMFIFFRRIMGRWFTFLCILRNVK